MPPETLIPNPSNEGEGEIKTDLNQAEKNSATSVDAKVKFKVKKQPVSQDLPNKNSLEEGAVEKVDTSVKPEAIKLEGEKPFLTTDMVEDIGRKSNKNSLEEGAVEKVDTSVKPEAIKLEGEKSPLEKFDQLTTDIRGTLDRTGVKPYLYLGNDGKPQIKFHEFSFFKNQDKELTRDEVKDRIGNEEFAVLEKKVNQLADLAIDNRDNKEFPIKIEKEVLEEAQNERIERQVDKTNSPDSFLNNLYNKTMNSIKKLWRSKPSQEISAQSVVDAASGGKEILKQKKAKLNEVQEKKRNWLTDILARRAGINIEFLESTSADLIDSAIESGSKGELSNASIQLKRNIENLRAVERIANLNKKLEEERKRDIENSKYYAEAARELEKRKKAKEESRKNVESLVEEAAKVDTDIEIRVRELKKVAL